MAISLKAELDRMGYRGHEDDFRDVLVETLHNFCPSWTDEQLLCNPTVALKYCKVVRKAARFADGVRVREANELILRTLVNTRKQQKRRAA
jgi:hypothetical protein